MTTFVLALLAAALLALSGITDPDSHPRAELGTRRPSSWKGRGRWLLGLLLGVPLVTVWFAVQTAVYLAAAVVATLAVLLASAVALDGRALCVRRVEAGQPSHFTA
ncbi:hypothetical protein ABZW11_04875 [Nonomuraea sp. NPDC004580]|uniref:hypothetical protein n=1 Tax=Nonomuraea sp. NPDC004580 TaxID=3154552 RepID=UPI0033A11DCC